MPGTTAHHMFGALKTAVLKLDALTQSTLNNHACNNEPDSAVLLQQTNIHQAHVCSAAPDKIHQNLALNVAQIGTRH
jgi:hypothetical protein